ncbi:MAG TPA: TetR/AcrR family transcriptional regulator [Candidatus Polarisedimenticolaceae bacterium]|nr:TetR/AcrR family transcriptional regulator [Candidatus Polarisedimenticolaceae bacterium]
MVQNSNTGSTDRLQRRAETRRTEILAAAARVFRRRGYADAGMREIAAEADLSPGNLYHYFRGKEEILCFCQQRALERLLGALERASRPGLPVAARLGQLLHAHVICLLDEFEGAAAHLEPEAVPAETRAAIVEQRDRYERGVRQLITAGVASGEFTPCDERVVTRAMLGALNWSARWFRPDGPDSPSRIADELSRYLVRGLASGRRGPPAHTGAAGPGVGHG